MANETAGMPGYAGRAWAGQDRDWGSCWVADERPLNMTGNKKALLVFYSEQGGPVMGVWEGVGAIFDL